MTEDKMVEWHHQLNGHQFEQAPGDGEGQGSLLCCSPWGRRESDMTERLNNNTNKYLLKPYLKSSCTSHCCCCIVTRSGPTLLQLHGLALQAPQSMGFPRQQYKMGMPFPSPGDLPNPGIEPTSLAVKADSLPLIHQGSPALIIRERKISLYPSLSLSKQ